MERQWNDDERNELLADILKSAHVHPLALLDVIRRHNVQFSWESVPLPRGRPLASCRNEYDRLIRQHPPAQSPYPTPLLYPPPQLKRPLSYAEGTSFPGTRSIQPKPPMYGGQPSVSSPTEPPPKRKRGRPTKQEQEARAAAAASSSQGQPTSASSRASTTQPAQQVATPAPPMSPMQIDPLPRPQQQQQYQQQQQTPAPQSHPPPTTRMPISQIISTPTGPGSSNHSSSSSGKRRRGRSTRSMENAPASAPATAGAAYESPYSTMSEDTPARTAAMRHREELGTPFQPAPSASRPDPR